MTYRFICYSPIIPFSPKVKLSIKEYLALIQIWTNKANILLDLILSRPLAEVINRVDTSTHRVIISNTLVRPLLFLIAKINVFDHK